MDFAQIILSPFVWLLTFFYNIFDSYGIALIIFAVIVKLILFPFALKGKRSMIQMNMLQGKMQKLQKQYGNNPQRYNLEVQKLYEREKVNPMGGCLWSFLPLLILLPLYAIIRQPIKYMMGINSGEVLTQIAQVVNWNSVAISNGWIREAAETFSDAGYNQLYLASLITPENLDAVKAAVGELGSRVFSLNFDFLGVVDLARVPALKFWAVEGGLALFLLPVVSMRLQPAVLHHLHEDQRHQPAGGSGGQQCQHEDHDGHLPLISLWIGFSMPAALCLYWIAQNVLSMLQEFICGKLLKKDYEEAARKQAEREQQEKEEEKEERRRKAEERARRIEEEKLNKGKKKKTEKKHEDDVPGIVKEYSRVGIRQYARGRAYDPYRYSEDGPTCYPGEEPIFASRKPDHAASAEEEKPSLPETAAEIKPSDSAPAAEGETKE